MPEQNVVSDVNSIDIYASKSNLYIYIYIVKFFWNDSIKIPLRVNIGPNIDILLLAGSLSKVLSKETFFRDCDPFVAASK